MALGDTTVHAQAARSPRVPVGLSRWPVPHGDEDQAPNHANHAIKPRERGLLLLLALLLQQSDPAGAGGLHSPDPWPDPAVLGSWQGGALLRAEETAGAEAPARGRKMVLGWRFLMFYFSGYYQYLG